MKSQSVLSKYLSASIEQPVKANTNESIVLSAIVCSACIGYAAGPMLNNEFFKSVGAGLGNLLSGIGSLFGNFGFGSISNKDTIKELLKKDADDLTGREKDILKRAANNKRLQKDLSNNEIKALNKAIGKSAEDNADLDDVSKELHALLKKKPEDLSPREKKRLSEINDNYDIYDELSDTELKRFQKATGSAIEDTGKPTEDTDTTKPDITPALLMMAKKANESEEDETKKSKNNALIDLITASTYDENGDIIPIEKRAEKMKSIIGDGWEDFKSKMEKTIKDSAESEDFKSALKNAKDNLTEKDVEKFTAEAKENAKKTHERLAKEKEERAELDKQIKDLESKIEGNENTEETEKLKKDLEKLKSDRAELDKKSLINQSIGKPEGEPKPEDYTDKEIEKIQNELAELDPEKDKDAIKEKENLLRSIAKANGKDEDEFIPKETEVTDPETGKKIKRVVHTGPRGGRFYYPDGKPKTPDHKVYVENKYEGLSNYLNECLNCDYQLSHDAIVNESLAIATTLAAASSSVTSKRVALLFIKKIVKAAKKYIKIAFRIFNDLNMKDKIQELNNSDDVLKFIKDVVTDDNAGLDDPKDIAIVTAIILAIWYITKWNAQKTKEYIKSVDTQLYTELKPELAY